MELPASKLQRKNLLLKAKLAAETERYDDTVLFMREIVSATRPEEDLSLKERCLLAAAFKNIVDGLRIARLIITYPNRSFCRDGVAARAAGEAFLHVIKTEITDVCTDFLQLIDHRLFPSAITNDAKVFYLTLKGDFSWYLAEVKNEKEGRDAQAAIDAYKDASEVAIHLDLLNPSRLSLELSMTEFTFRHIHNPLEARGIVEQTLNRTLMESLSRPAVSTLCFEGGIQLQAKLSNLKQRLDDQKQTNADGHGTAYLSLASIPTSSESPIPLLETVKGKAAAIIPPAGLASAAAETTSSCATDSSNAHRALPLVSITATPSSYTAEVPMGANQVAAGTITSNIVAAVNNARAAAVNGLLAFITCCCCRGI